MIIPIALSPCPNDTFVFHAWDTGCIANATPIDITFADIQTLNDLAKSATFPLIKVSIAAFKELQSYYSLLQVGCALGDKCGPKLIANHPFSLDDLSTKTVAFPGSSTTAHYLYNLLMAEPKHKVFCPYNKIAETIASGKADCGVIIHESRFTYKEQGFIELLDLGEKWHSSTKLPLPLGGLALRRDLPEEMKQHIVECVEASLLWAETYPQHNRDYILKYAQEKESYIVDAHIQTYVTQETRQLSSIGILAIETLIQSPSHMWLTCPN